MSITVSHRKNLAGAASEFGLHLVKIKINDRSVIELQGWIALNGADMDLNRFNGREWLLRQTI